MILYFHKEYSVFFSPFEQKKKKNEHQDVFIVALLFLYLLLIYEIKKNEKEKL